jgi:hypothetical protein
VPVLYLDTGAEAAGLSRAVEEWTRTAGNPAGAGNFIRIQSPEQVSAAVDLLLARLRKEDQANNASIQHPSTGLASTP